MRRICNLFSAIILAVRPEDIPIAVNAHEKLTH